MCLALPAEIKSIEDTTAEVEVDGVLMPVSLAFLPDAAVGDFVIVHVGFAMSKIDASAAEAQLNAMHQLTAEEGVGIGEGRP